MSQDEHASACKTRRRKRRARLAPLEEQMGRAREWPQWLRAKKMPTASLPINIVKPHVSAKPWLQRSATRRPSESGASRPASLARRRRRGERSRHASMLPAWRRRQVPARAGRNRRLRLERLDRSSATRHRRPSGALSPRHDGRWPAARQLDADGSLRVAGADAPSSRRFLGFWLPGREREGRSVRGWAQFLASQFLSASREKSGG